MGEGASQITSLTIVYSTVYPNADQRKHQSSASLAFVRGIHRGPVNSPHKWPVTRKMSPFDDVIMITRMHICFMTDICHGSDWSSKRLRWMSKFCGLRSTLVNDWTNMVEKYFVCSYSCVMRDIKTGAELIPSTSLVIAWDQIQGNVDSKLSCSLRKTCHIVLQNAFSFNVFMHDCNSRICIDLSITPTN